ncbi:40S ribosomal protein S23-2 [Zea mays]|uniref:40S ribosomal protein S23-2 n=1 Tax=Zea mays TaxID=4577 RepID=A0A1D6LL85_MAIZE|nr:40S ribosomal protein S23-2 [Zea mays]
MKKEKKRRKRTGKYNSFMVLALFSTLVDLMCFKDESSCFSSKTRGMGAGRKLKTHRRNQRWADKAYKKSHLGNEWKKPFAGSSHAKGIVLEKIGIEAKQPNSAIRKCARV